MTSFIFKQFHCRKWLQTFVCPTKTTNITLSKGLQIFLFTLWKQVPKWYHILFSVGMTGSSANRLFKTELHFRFMVKKPTFTSNWLIFSLGKEKGFVKGAILSAWSANLLVIVSLWKNQHCCTNLWTVWTLCCFSATSNFICWDDLLCRPSNSSTFSNLLNTRYSDPVKNLLNTRY